MDQNGNPIQKSGKWSSRTMSFGYFQNNQLWLEFLLPNGLVLPKRFEEVATNAERYDEIVAYHESLKYKVSKYIWNGWATGLASTNQSSSCFSLGDICEYGDHIVEVIDFEDIGVIKCYEDIGGSTYNSSIQIKYLNPKNNEFILNPASVTFASADELILLIKTRRRGNLNGIGAYYKAKSIQQERELEEAKRTCKSINNRVFQKLRKKWKTKLKKKKTGIKYVSMDVMGMQFKKHVRKYLLKQIQVKDERASWTQKGDKHTLCASNKAMKYFWGKGAIKTKFGLAEYKNEDKHNKFCYNDNNERLCFYGNIVDWNTGSKRVKGSQSARDRVLALKKRLKQKQQQRT